LLSHQIDPVVLDLGHIEAIGRNPKMKTIALLIGVSALICSSVLAYTFQSFSDLDSLMEYSDFIVVARIADPIRDNGCDPVTYKDGLVRYDVIVVHNVRGELSLNRYPVILQSGFIRDYHNFRPGKMALLFLTDRNSIGGKKVLMNTSDSGSIMPARPNLDLSKLRGLSEKQQIEFILKDYVNYKEEELKALKSDLSTIK
jgi:hypothetical protein